MPAQHRSFILTKSELFVPTPVLKALLVTVIT